VIHVDHDLKLASPLDLFKHNRYSVLDSQLIQVCDEEPEQKASSASRILINIDSDYN